eukprot:TRINITY_DN9353_c0_g1_i2.p1 TRINITY_DN9353_c0_g1~~TRINITY_DN9353_c0_g1_i2.p1  ORF type:complete len:367 (-),score=58.95 TRINITY_DN9353_c0_g1_i2:55-1110(-)
MEAAVTLNIYDLDAWTGCLNQKDSWTRRNNLGIFHCGVEVYGLEYSFVYFYDGWEDDSLPGIRRDHPRRNPQFIFRESLPLGCTPLSPEEIRELMSGLNDRWAANSYQIIENNCVSFADALAAALQVASVPRWVHGLAATATAVAPLRYIVGIVWRLVVWVMILTAREERDRAFEADAAAAEAKKPTRGLLRWSCLSPGIGAATLVAASLMRRRGVPLGTLALSLMTLAAAAAPRWTPKRWRLQWPELLLLRLLAVWTALRGILSPQRTLWPLGYGVALALFLELRRLLGEGFASPTSTTGSSSWRQVRGANGSGQRSGQPLLDLDFCLLLAHVCGTLALLSLAWAELAGG